MRPVRLDCSHPRRGGWILIAALAVLLPATARAQYGAPSLESSAIGERYHVELSGTFWNPNVYGVIASEQWGIPGSQIDFTNDLGFKTTRFRDIKATLRPSRKTKFRVQYTPVRYQAESSLKRSVIFNGQTFPVNLPVHSAFDWNVLRVGMEYDFVYRSRGFVGLLLEGRYTQMNASLATPITSEKTSVKAPLPAAGLVGRVYPVRELALNFEVSMFRMPKGLLPDVEANYYDWNIDGTINVSHHLGLQVGWRRMTNFLNVKEDLGETKFQGMWFGAAVRY